MGFDGLPFSAQAHRRLLEDTLGPRPTGYDLPSRIAEVVEEVSAAHLTVVDSLVEVFTADEAVIAAQVGRDVLDETLTAHRLWNDWLRTGRIRKFALVTQRRR